MIVEYYGWMVQLPHSSLHYDDIQTAVNKKKDSLASLGM